MIHDYVPGVRVWLEVNNEVLQEYDDEDGEEGTTMSRFVEATTGTSFTAHIRFEPAFAYKHDDIEVWVCLDGKKASGKIQDRGSLRPMTIEGVKQTVNGQSYLQKFQFSDLSTNDGPAKADMKEKLKDLGTISIVFTRCIKTVSDQQADREFKESGSSTVPEKSLKGRAISNRATYGAREKTAPVHWVSAVYPYGDAPFATFNFKYRSHRDLQIEGIIERSPTPPPLEERDPSTLTHQEAIELVRRAREREAEQVRIKREKRERSTTINGEDDDGEVAVTGVGPSKRRRTSDDSGIDIIDLTDD